MWIINGYWKTQGISWEEKKWKFLWWTLFYVLWMVSFYSRCNRQFTWRTSLKRHVSKCDGNTNLNPRSSCAESSALEVQSGTPVMFLVTEKAGCDDSSVVQKPLKEGTLRETGTDVLKVRTKGTTAQFVVVNPSQSSAMFIQPSVVHPNITLQSQTSNVHKTITVDSANNIMYVPVVSTEQNHQLPGSGSSQ